jgi:hypothetical protein
VICGADAEFAQFQLARVDRGGIGEAVQHDVAALRRQCLRGGEANAAKRAVIKADLPASM